MAWMGRKYLPAGSDEGTYTAVSDPHWPEGFTGETPGEGELSTLST